MRKKLIAATGFFLSMVFCTVVLWDGEIEKYDVGRVSADVGETMTIVIDPGHGGYDGGAEAKDGTKEKTLNLQIAMRLKEVIEEYPVNVVLTRDTDTDLIPQEKKDQKGSKKRQDILRRKEIIENNRPVLAVSIHMNSYPQDEYVYGPQVFYPGGLGRRTDGRDYEQISKEYAENVQKSIETRLPDGRTRNPMAKEDILIFEEITCPIILVECGFLSNNRETERLKSLEYQGQMALAIWEGINEKLCLEKRKNIEIVIGENKLF